MSTKTFINLPVKDLDRTRDFFGRLGFSFNEQFSDDTTACLVISDDAYAMLHVEPVFQGFAASQVADDTHTREVIVGLSADSRQRVDELADTAVDSGGQAVGDPQDQGAMYMRAIRDLDGHQWSFIHMDMSAVPAQ